MIVRIIYRYVFVNEKQYTRDIGEQYLHEIRGGMCWEEKKKICFTIHIL